MKHIPNITVPLAADAHVGALTQDPQQFDEIYDHWMAEYYSDECPDSSDFETEQP